MTEALKSQIKSSPITKLLFELEVELKKPREPWKDTDEDESLLIEKSIQGLSSSISEYNSSLKKILN